MDGDRRRTMRIGTGRAPEMRLRDPKHMVVFDPLTVFPEEGNARRDNRRFPPIPC